MQESYKSELCAKENILAYETQTKMGSEKWNTPIFLSIIVHLGVSGWLNQEGRDGEHAEYASHIWYAYNICYKAKLK
jgi:hypothetical protein